MSDYRVGEKFIRLVDSKLYRAGMYVLVYIDNDNYPYKLEHMNDICDCIWLWRNFCSHSSVWVRFNELSEQEQFIYHLSGKVPERFL